MKKRILFYSTMEPQIYHYKIAKNLQKKGYETILFTISDKDDKDIDFYIPVFDKIYRSKFEIRKPGLKYIFYALKKAPRMIRFLIQSKLIKADVVIGISGINWQIKLAKKYLYKNKPFIFFTHDIKSQFFNSKKEALRINPNFEVEAEKYNFENCDGIIHKGSPEELNAINGRVFKNINFSQPQLSFEPYCSKEFFVPINKNKLSKKDNEIHIVYVGFFWTNQDDAVTNFIKKILDQKIHFHVYQKNMAHHLPMEKEKDYVNNYFSKIINNKYFHIHDTLPPKELIKEISKYDYGIFPHIPISKNNIEPQFCASNKIASYLEAGLPPICDRGLKHLRKVLTSYGIDISFDSNDIETLGKKLKEKDYKVLEKNVEKAREDYSVENNIEKLDTFIKDVIKNSV